MRAAKSQCGCNFSDRARCVGTPVTSSPLKDIRAMVAAYSAKVAVIGGGAAGMTAVRELRREGHYVEVFEQQGEVGGVWVLDENTESDPLGKDPSRTIVHSSMYDSLRVNLPRELMGFSDFPFLPKFMKGRSQDARRFPHHTEVRWYLEAFADHFGIRDAIHFNTRVNSIQPIRGTTSSASDGATPGCSHPSARWEVRVAPALQRGASCSAAGSTMGVYDAVMVCNGHYSAPRTPDFPGLDTYPGACEHSHSYRHPDVYSGKRVLIVGAHASGEDIAWDIAPYAAAVVMSAKSWMKEEFAHVRGPFGPANNMYRRPWVSRMGSDGTIEFEDGSSVQDIDIVMFCTGYHYAMPFLDAEIVDTSRSHVRPLYQHLLHPAFGASLSFVGLPFKVVPFPQFEVQTRYVARLLSGKATLPSQHEMHNWMESHYRQFDDGSAPDRHGHLQGGGHWDYNDELSELSGCSDFTPEWRKGLWRHARELKQKYEPTEYRDKWDDHAVAEMAHAAFDELDKEEAGSGISADTADAQGEFVTSA
eukprot:jgi/Ulvmu1/5074/UM021_0091.1